MLFARLTPVMESDVANEPSVVVATPASVTKVPSSIPTRDSIEGEG